MTEPTHAAAVDDALKTFRDTLAKDGYLLSWSQAADDAVVVKIEAGPDACADCLVPQPVMQAIMSDALSSTPYRLERVELPAEH